MPRESAESAAAMLQAPGSIQSKLSAEAQLLTSLPERASSAAIKHVQAHPMQVAAEGAAAFGIGLGMAALTKNPELLGVRAAPFIREALPWAGKMMLAAGILDWGSRIGMPMYDTWQNPDRLDQNKDLLGTNIGTGIVDYAAMGIGGYGGARTAFKIVPEYPNRFAPIDLHPSETLGQKPRITDHPEAFKTQPERTLKEDVVDLYERSFPEDERQPTEQVAKLIESGKILLHTTRTEDGTLQAFSFVSRHDETPVKFANLDFIASEPSARSHGIGSLHLQRVGPELQRMYPEYTAMTLEMEHPTVPGLDAETLATRARRARFYDRLDAPDTGIRYNILDFNDPQARIPAQFRAFIFRPEEFHPVRTARTFYLDEAGYARPPRDPAIRQLESENNYYTPQFGPVRTAINVDALTNAVKRS